MFLLSLRVIKVERESSIQYLQDYFYKAFI
jgi:hypothetical protein